MQYRTEIVSKMRSQAGVRGAAFKALNGLIQHRKRLCEFFASAVIARMVQPTIVQSAGRNRSSGTDLTEKYLWKYLDRVFKKKVFIFPTKYDIIELYSF